MVINLRDPTHRHIQLLFILDTPADLAYNNILFCDAYCATFGERYWCKGFLSIAGAHRVFTLTKIKWYGRVERVGSALKLMCFFAGVIFMIVDARKGQFR
jgi:hypothetical protein